MSASDKNSSAIEQAGRRVEQLVQRAGRVLLGKEQTIRLALACMLVHGHLLVEDLPGVGKTILAHLLARLFGLAHQRIQFTSDMLPADILGYSVYSRQTDTFQFHPGPVFAQVVLADEINRATPKAQSALLEAMEERQVTVEGHTRELPYPFFVIATQNPFSQIGAFPLPESQVDRFTMRLSLGYPDMDSERELLRGADRRQVLHEMEPPETVDWLLGAQKLVSTVHVSDALLDYLQELLRFSRESPNYELGLSPRAGLAALHCGQAWALMNGRSMVLPEDLQAVLPGTISHRLRLRGGPGKELGADDAVRELIAEIPIP